MGNVNSRPDESAALYLRDQGRLSISSLCVTNSRRRIILNVVPNAFPATRLSATRDMGDASVLEYVQDPEPSSPGLNPNFIFKLNNDEELAFNFTFVIRQAQQVTQGANGAQEMGKLVDTNINGLTYVSASTAKEVETLVTREFHADPNLHKNANVQLVGDFATEGSQSVSFEWSWKWRPPKAAEDRGGGWRNECSFVEYDQRAHRLVTLASFSFWVSNNYQFLSQPNSPLPPFHLVPPPKLRFPSAQSVESRLSGQDSHDYDEPPSPDTTQPAESFVVPQKDVIKVDVSCQRPGEDMSATEDGPLFRATMKALEQKTAYMRPKMKKVLKKAEAARAAQIDCNDAVAGFMEALREASSSNANAVQPALEHYFDKIAREILAYEKQNTVNLQRIIIDPLTKLYTLDIKQAEAKKRDFEEESKDYYAYVSRYLGQRQDSLKEKKRAESDNKYQTKRRNFELKRFDYSSFMQDLHGGRREQELLSQLTKFANAQTTSFLTTSKKVDEMLPQLDALSAEVENADKEFQYQRTEREEKRRNLEKSTTTYVEPETVPAIAIAPAPYSSAGTTSYISDSEMNRSDSTASQLRPATNGTTMTTSPAGGATNFPRSPGSLSSGLSSLSSPTASSKFRGIRDLEEKDHTQVSVNSGTQRKEGLLWALSKPGSHVDPRGLNKQAWHKFWIVLDAGKLSEYSNWKERLDLHMDPIDLRMASVREARNAERRFCFEIITPHYKRVYQSTSEEDLNSWISAINNAIQSAVEGRGSMRDIPASTPSSESFSIRRDIGSILTGKSSSVNHGSNHPSRDSAARDSTVNGSVFRRTTVGARPAYARKNSNGFDEPDKLLQLLREADQGNCWCADCGSNIKTEWVSINLAIILCIECSGIHRSLGTHISKVRSLTLDINSFTTDIVELLLLVGNRISNMVWEAKLDRAIKPAPTATREERLRFITAKYVDRLYVEPISTTLSHYATPDETLLAAIKKNEMQQVLYALALRANPNVTDKSRGTHSIFLALAAADPASPSPMAIPVLPESSSGRVTAFPIAELLVQNGAEIPSTLPMFPLSRSAALYIEQKTSRGSGSDILGSLPTSNPMERQQREREARLQKRVSAGGRLAKAPILER